ncbi:MAG: DUF1924 domain-containing protein [SAR324 cluster bacterium]|nr:DUF1924 domain-containing protein [SAR324 cluster bacterium]
MTSLIVTATPLTPVVQNYLQTLSVEAKEADPHFKNFSAEKGQNLLFQQRRHSVENEMRACTTCHTNDFSKQGQTVVGKAIEPFSPAVNQSRFRDLEKIEKWFRRNCKWVLERECTSAEKGNSLTYLFSL